MIVVSYLSQLSKKYVVGFDYFVSISLDKTSNSNSNNILFEKINKFKILNQIKFICWNKIYKKRGLPPILMKTKCYTND